MNNAKPLMLIMARLIFYWHCGSDFHYDFSANTNHSQNYFINDAKSKATHFGRMKMNAQSKITFGKCWQKIPMWP